MVEITDVEKNSYADKSGILPGDYLISINGNDIGDVLDYRYYLAEKQLTLKIHRGPELFDVVVKKGEYDDIGLAFSSYLMDKKHTCRNKCVFCFIDQNPAGMRDTIYFKDDDARMSFLTGSYITLTNLSEHDIDRIIKMKISPVNISVHTTNPELRCKMMNNRFAGDALLALRRFADAGTVINAQIVLCRTLNDGAELDRTMRELTEYLPALRSVAVVPAGLTAHREGLYPLRPFTPRECAEIIKQVDAAAEKCLEKFGSRVFFCGDEFYIKSGLPLPDEDYYEDYPQLDNGVGLIASMQGEFNAEYAFLDEYDLNKPRKFSVATGEAAYDFISTLVSRIKERSPSFDCRVYMIKNSFFGENITVAGLVCGGDLCEQLKGQELGERLVIPSVMLRYEKDMFLDSVTTDEVSAVLGVPLYMSDNDGAEFISTLLW